MTDEQFEKVYGQCVEFLKERVSYMWKEGANPIENSVSTWSNRISYASIKKRGTARDKSYLEAGNRNKERQQGSKRKRERSANIRHPTRQDRYIRRGLQQHHGASNDHCGAVGGAGASFEEVFADVGEMTATMEERMEEIQQDVGRADEEDHRVEEERRIREEGLAYRPSPLLRNYGDVSGFDRQRLGERMAAILPPRIL